MTPETGTSAEGTSDGTDVVRYDVVDATAVVTINRPAARNALSSEVLRALPAALHRADADPDVRAVVLTGADPVFCAGLDLRELGSGRTNLATGAVSSPWPPLGKPLIGAINGAAVTGGLELALQCDFLVASERARFGDTHARVGILPGWGLTVLLPQAVGLRRAKEMSMTGNFMDAAEALERGLVNHVVAHDQLLPTALALAADIASNDPDATTALLASYKETAATTLADGLTIEHRVAVEWKSRTFDPAEVARRREAVIARGRGQG
jgi:enoyl-CoA hydratase